MHRHSCSTQSNGWPLVLDASSGLLCTCLLKLPCSLLRIVQTQCQSTVLPEIPRLWVSGGAVWAGKNLGVDRFTLCLSLHSADSADGWVCLCCEVVCLWKMLSSIYLLCSLETKNGLSTHPRCDNLKCVQTMTSRPVDNYDLNWKSYI